ncbi:MAG TPA: chemotaxis protein CheW [Thermoanaerobaculia bacterium]|nr:chemotaxis protein CheW [Thermoanaerobaculia bacterium]
MTNQYLTFSIAGQECASGILDVREIIGYADVTPLPQAPPWIRGLINLRGSVVPVVDLAVKFGRAASAPTRRTCIVVTEVTIASEKLVMGIIADAVNQVVELRADDIVETPSFGASRRVDYLHGMGKIGSALVLMLDLDAILATDDVLDVMDHAVAAD